MNALLLFGAMFITVFLMAAQNLFINNGKYLRAFFMSAAISVSQIILFKFAPNASAIEVAGFLAGGPFGVVTAMWVFRALHRK